MNDRIGQQFGNYRLIRLPGEGGFAEVYLAEHLHLKTHAAIKILYGHMSTQDVQNFTKEAQTIATLRHPHIIGLFDFDVQNGVPFLVMDYAPNGSLAEKYPLPTILALSVVTSYARQIGEALEYAHNQHFIHRDMKPENILIGRHNELLLSDFGIATIAHISTSLRTQTIVGTTPYMAPEQIVGKPCLASDQYALGIMVYSWLCGKLPFEGSAMEIVAQHLSAPPPPPHAQNPSVSPHVERVLLKALAKEPSQRFPTVSDFILALEQARDDTVKNRPLQQPLPPTIPAHAAPPPQSTRIAFAPHALPVQEISPEIDKAYEKLRQETQRHILLSYMGAIVVRADDHQIGQVVHMLAEDTWIKNPGKRTKHHDTKSAYVRNCSVGNRSIAAAIFTNIHLIPNAEYVVWIDDKKPASVSIPGGKAALVDLRHLTQHFPMKDGR